MRETLDARKRWLEKYRPRTDHSVWPAVGAPLGLSCPKWKFRPFARIFEGFGPTGCSTSKATFSDPMIRVTSG
jgi:hypothetical protein